MALLPQVNTGYFNNFLRPKGLGAIISDEDVQLRQANNKAELARIKQEAVGHASPSLPSPPSTSFPPFPLPPTHSSFSFPHNPTT